VPSLLGLLRRKAAWKVASAVAVPVETTDAPVVPRRHAMLLPQATRRVGVLRNRLFFSIILPLGEYVPQVLKELFDLL
jgi:hypothetical protein